jgi:hypothetical protein
MPRGGRKKKESAKTAVENPGPMVIATAALGEGRSLLFEREKNVLGMELPTRVRILTSARLFF